MHSILEKVIVYEHGYKPYLICNYDKYNINNNLKYIEGFEIVKV